MIDLDNLTPKQKNYAAFLSSHGYDEEHIIIELEKVEDERFNH